MLLGVFSLSIAAIICYVQCGNRNQVSPILKVDPKNLKVQIIEPGDDWTAEISVERAKRACLEAFKRLCESRSERHSQQFRNLRHSQMKVVIRDSANELPPEAFYTAHGHFFGAEGSNSEQYFFDMEIYSDIIVAYVTEAAVEYQKQAEDWLKNHDGSARKFHKFPYIHYSDMPSQVEDALSVDQLKPFLDWLHSARKGFYANMDPELGRGAFVRIKKDEKGVIVPCNPFDAKK